MRYNKFYDYIKDYNKNYNPKLPYIYVSNTVVPCRLCDPGLTANVLCTSRWEPGGPPGLGIPNYEFFF